MPKESANTSNIGDLSSNLTVDASVTMLQYGLPACLWLHNNHLSYAVPLYSHKDFKVRKEIRE